MAFFTADFSPADLFFTWSEHQRSLRTKRLQPHNDFLYELVKSDILDRREELSKDLLMVASTALTPQGLSIPLWSYNAASYDRPPICFDADKYWASEEMLRRKGYQWFVGLVPKGEEPDVRYDAEGWDQMWRWRDAKPVHDVVRNTDFLQRLTLLFGAETFRITYSILSEERLTEPLPVRVMKVELRLHYYPKGLPPGVAVANQRAEEKYADHVPASSPWLMPFITKGEREVSTPPAPVRLLGDPPALPQRSNGGGIEAPASRVDPCPSPRAIGPSDTPVASVLHYEGADALQRAARDMLTAFNSSDDSTVAPSLGPAPAGQYIYYNTGPDGQRTCHCYFSDDDEE